MLLGRGRLEKRKESFRENEKKLVDEKKIKN